MGATLTDNNSISTDDANIGIMQSSLSLSMVKYVTQRSEKPNVFQTRLADCARLLQIAYSFKQRLVQLSNKF